MNTIILNPEVLSNNLDELAKKFGVYRKEAVQPTYLISEFFKSFERKLVVIGDWRD